MVTQQSRAEATRRRLMKAFRASFLKHGFDGTTTQHVLAEMGLSKGALYHHFQSKSDVIEAIYEEESRGAIERAVHGIDKNAPPLARLRDACLAWTEEVRSPGISKILFEIGPSALGRRRAKEIEDAFSLALIEGLLKEAALDGEIDLEEPALIAAMINALVAEASLHTVRTGKETNETLAMALDALFQSLQK